MAITYLSGGRIQGRSDDVSGTASFTPSNTFNVEYLIVGAGASGGTYNGGGGGAGAYRVAASQELTSGVKYSVIVGAKGTFQFQPAYEEIVSGERERRTGGDTSFIGTGLSITSSGGGWGGDYHSGDATYSGNGSSGGAGNNRNSADSGTHGYDGGNGGDSGAGGGGGSAQAGASSVGTSDGGDGGNGTQNDITGTNLYYAGGGGGGGVDPSYDGGDGGLGGGGNGCDLSPCNASDASASGSNAGYGSGGGGARGSAGTGGDGFGGVVIIRFTTSGNSGTLVGGTADTSTVSGQTIITFTAANSPKVAANKSTITDVPVGTRFEETDTRKIFRMAEQTTSDLGTAANVAEVGSVTAQSTNKLLGTNALDLDGASGTYINMNNILNCMTTTGTISFWARSEGTSAYTIAWSDTNGLSYFHITNEHSPATCRVDMTINDSQQYRIDSTSGSWGSSDRGWKHIVLTQDGTAVKFYFNGIEQTSFTSESNKSKWISHVTGAGADNVRWGAKDVYNQGIQGNINGQLDDFAIWSRAITAAEVAILYNGGTGAVATSISGTGMKVYYSCNSLSGSTLVNECPTTTSVWVEKGTA